VNVLLEVCAPSSEDANENSNRPKIILGVSHDHARRRSCDDRISRKGLRKDVQHLTGRSMSEILSNLHEMKEVYHINLYPVTGKLADALNNAGIFVERIQAAIDAVWQASFFTSSLSFQRTYDQVLSKLPTDQRLEILTYVDQHKKATTSAPLLGYGPDRTWFGAGLKGGGTLFVAGMEGFEGAIINIQSPRACFEFNITSVRLGPGLGAGGGLALLLAYNVHYVADEWNKSPSGVGGKR
jgi:hypothetical protein